MSELQSLLKKLNKDFKSGDIEVGVDYQDIEKVPFKSVRLNYMTYGGLPVGRIIEFSGADGSGKTTTALDILAQCQKLYPDKKALFCDIEGTFDSNWSSKLGVDLDNIILYRTGTQTAEDVFNALLELIDTGEISVCVLDSLGAMVSEQAYEKSIGEKTYAGISQSLTTFSKKLVPILARTKCMFIGINQIRDDLNSVYGGTITTGGRAWRHNCSVRLSFRKGKFIDEKGTQLSNACENPYGNIVNVALEKSKVCPPNRKVGYYTLVYRYGVDYISDLIDVLLKEGLLVSSGAWYTFVDTSGEPMKNDSNEDLKFQGKNKVKQFLESNQDMLNSCFNEINKLIAKQE